MLFCVFIRYKQPNGIKIIIIKTKDGSYVKMNITSYYKDSPENPTDYTAVSVRFYSFKYVFLDIGTKVF